MREEKPFFYQRRRQELSSLAKETRLGELYSLIVVTSILYWFWVPEEELLGGTSLAARQHMAVYPILGYWMKGLAGVLIYPPSDANLLG